MANQVSHDVSAYRVDENGALIPLPESPFGAGTESVSVGADPTGKFVYVASKFNHNVSAFRVGANGTLTPVAGSPFPAGVGPNSVAFSPEPEKARGLGKNPKEILSRPETAVYPESKAV